MFGLGPTELIIIAVIIVLIFGAKRIPEIGKGLGGAIREFRNVKKELSGQEQPAEEQDNKSELRDDGSESLESKIVDEFLEDIPAVKKVKEVKKNVEKIQKIVD
jgi:sec-independent protein translocase protein TatA